MKTGRIIAMTISSVIPVLILVFGVSCASAQQAVQFTPRHGSTSEHSTFTGVLGELTVDTDKNVVVIHDGTTAGGHPASLASDLTAHTALANAHHVQAVDTGPVADCVTATHVQIQDGSCLDPATQAELDTHTTDVSNPHSVTAAQASAVALADKTGSDTKVVSGVVGVAEGLGVWKASGDFRGAISINHSVLVGDGAIHNARIVPDCPDTDNQRMNFAQSGDAWSCGIGPTITSYQYPGGVAGTSITTPADDLCRCIQYPMPMTMLDIDKMTVSIAVSDATDTGDMVGMYSLDGQTKYFSSTLDVTGVQTIELTNSITTPAAMSPGMYFVCFSRGAATDPDTYKLDGGTIAGLMGEASVTCTGGVLPATFTPSVTWGKKIFPVVGFADE